MNDEFYMLYENRYILYLLQSILDVTRKYCGQFYLNLRPEIQVMLLH